MLNGIIALLEDPASVRIISPLLGIVGKEVHFEVEQISFRQKSTEIVKAISQVQSDVVQQIVCERDVTCRF